MNLSVNNLLCNSVESLPEDLKEYLPLFTAVMSQMGAGSRDYREFETEMDLTTGGLSSGVHLAEAPNDVNDIRQGIFLNSLCLERNVDKMFGLWNDLFNDIHFKPENVDRLKLLVKQGATAGMSSVAMRGHSYAMSHASAKIQPGPNMREQFSGLENLRFTNSLSREDDVKFLEVMNRLKAIGDILLTKNHMKVALNVSEGYSDQLNSAVGSFLNGVKGDYSYCSTKDCSSLVSNEGPKNTYIVTPYPVYFCSEAVETVPYMHEDFANLRVLSRYKSYSCC